MNSIANTQEDPIAAAIKKNLADKLRGGMAELIPSEVYDRLAMEAVDAFLKGPITKRGEMVTRFMYANDERNTTGKDGNITFFQENEKYNAFEDTSTLPGMVMVHIREMAKENIKELLNKDEKFKSVWDSNYQTAFVTALDDIVKDNTQLFVQSMFKQIVNIAMMPMLDQMRRSSF